MRFPFLVSCSGIALAASTNFIAGAALAAGCQASTAGGVGLPSISATEASTAQALEVLERRKDEALANVELANIDTVVSASTNTGDSTGAPPGSPPKKPKAQPKTQPKSSPSSSADQPQGPLEGYADRSSRNGGWTRGVWALGYLDHERNSDVNIGQANAVLGTSGFSKDDVTVTKTQNGGGTLAGMDWTYFKPGPKVQGYQFGVFAGYDKSRSKFSDGKFSVFELDDPLNSDTRKESSFERLNARESYEGGSIGGFGALFLDRWTFDGTLKVDFANLEHQHTTHQLNCFDTIESKSGDVDLTEYTIAGNASYRYDLNRSSTFSPLVGMRYTYTDFGRSTGNIDLGAENGQILRLQGGAIVATTWTSAQGHIWTAAFTGLLYSDVWMDGFVGKAAFGDGNSDTAAGFVDAASLNDEGKLRVLGQVASSVAFGNGVSMFGDVELRGGAEYFGVGGRLGGRYEW